MERGAALQRLDEVLIDLPAEASKAGNLFGQAAAVTLQAHEVGACFRIPVGTQFRKGKYQRVAGMDQVAVPRGQTLFQLLIKRQQVPVQRIPPGLGVLELERGLDPGLQLYEA